MKNGWVSTQFGDVAKLVKGVSYASEDYCGQGEGLVFLTIKCVSKAGGFKHKGIKYFKGKHLESQLIEGGELLIANTDLTRAGDIIGAPIVVPSFDGSQVTMSMDLSKVVENREKIDRQFLYYLLMTDLVRRFMKDHASGSTVLHLQTRAVPSLVLNLPRQTAEQSKIAEILSTVVRAMEQTEALIAKQLRIKTGLMQDLLTRGIDEQGNLRSEETHQFKDSPLGRIPVEWVVKRLDSVARVKYGISDAIDVMNRSGVPTVTLLCIAPNGDMDLSPSKLVFTPQKAVKERDFLKNGDLLFNWRNGSQHHLGKTAYFEGNEGFTHVGFLLSIRTKPELADSRFLWYLINNIKSNGYFLNAKIQVNNTFNSTELNAVELAFPRIDEQRVVRERLDSLENTKFRTHVHLEKLRSLKTALMQDLLTGEKRVTLLLDSTVTN
jgi:type I restriction enzyme, S subunit